MGDFAKRGAHRWRVQRTKGWNALRPLGVWVRGDHRQNGMHFGAAFKLAVTHQQVLMMAVVN